MSKSCSSYSELVVDVVGRGHLDLDIPFVGLQYFAGFSITLDLMEGFLRVKLKLPSLQTVQRKKPLRVRSQHRCRSISAGPICNHQVTVCRHWSVILSSVI